MTTDTRTVLSGRSKLTSTIAITSIVIFVLFALSRFDSFGSPRSVLPSQNPSVSHDVPILHDGSETPEPHVNYDEVDLVDPHKSDDKEEHIESEKEKEKEIEKEKEEAKPKEDEKEKGKEEGKEKEDGDKPTKSGKKEVHVQTITYSAFPKATMHHPSGVPKPAIGLPSSYPPPAAHFAIRDKVAAITETRPLTGLIPLLLHYATVLGTDWPILFITTQETIDFYTKDRMLPAAFKRMLLTGQIRMIPLPDTVKFTWSLPVSIYLASKWFWDQLGSAEHLLLFQADAILCSNSPRRIEDYFEYDFVGAPIIPMWGGGFNGGLSYRNVSLSRKVIEKWDIMKDIENDVPHAIVEDQWFWMRMEELGGRMPSEDVGKTFSVESMWADMPLGYHQVLKWNEARLPEIEAWCPEWKLTTNQGILEKDSLVGSDNQTTEEKAALLKSIDDFSNHKEWKGADI